MTGLISMRVPWAVAVVAERLGAAEPGYRLRYPLPDEISTIAVAVWLSEYRSDGERGHWLLGDEHAGPDRTDQRPPAVARRLLFARALFESRHLDRGGRVER